VEEIRLIRTHNYVLINHDAGRSVFAMLPEPMPEFTIRFEVALPGVVLPPIAYDLAGGGDAEPGGLR
jgi:hypothetical protein